MGLPKNPSHPTLLASPGTSKTKQGRPGSKMPSRRPGKLTANSFKRIASAYQDRIPALQSYVTDIQ